MTLYNNIKPLHGLPRDGQTITFINPCTQHWNMTAIKDQGLLEIGKTYTVRKTQLNSSSTYVWLNEIETYDKEYDYPCFILSKKYFSWELPELTKEDFMGNDIRSALVVRHYYPNIGITFNNKTYMNGYPMWTLEVNEKSIITNAYKTQ